MDNDQKTEAEQKAKQKLVRYLTVAQHHQIQQRKKRHSPAQKAKWRLAVIIFFIILITTGLYGGLSEIGLIPTL